MSKEYYFEKALSWVSNKSKTSIRGQMEGIENTQVFKNKSTGEEIQEDFSFISQWGDKSFTEIGLKTENPQKLITRWKLLSLMASIKNGKLYLLTSKGHKMFTQKLIENNKINATIHALWQLAFL